MRKPAIYTITRIENTTQIAQMLETVHELLGFRMYNLYETSFGYYVLDRIDRDGNVNIYAEIMDEYKVIYHYLSGMMNALNTYHHESNIK